MNQRRAELERLCRTLGAAINEEMADASSGEPIGFALLLFDLDGSLLLRAPVERFMAYVSNAKRADIVKALREQADRLEAGTAHTAGES